MSLQDVIKIAKTDDPQDTLPWRVRVEWPPAWRTDPTDNVSIYRYPTQRAAQNAAADIAALIRNGG